MTNVRIYGACFWSGNHLVEVVAEAHDSNGDPVPPGVEVVFAVEHGERLMSFAEGAEASALTNEAGQASVMAETGTSVGRFNIAVNFKDKALGAGLTDSFSLRQVVTSRMSLSVVLKRGEQELTNPNERFVLADGTDGLMVEVGLVPPTPDHSVANQPITLIKRSGPGHFRAAEGVANDTLIVNTDHQGRVSVRFEGGVDAMGQAHIAVLALDRTEYACEMQPHTERELEEDVYVQVLRLGSVEFASLSQTELFTSDSAHQTSSTLTFRVLDPNRVPLEGLAVSFSLENAPNGTFVSPEVAISDSDGLVGTTIRSGTEEGMFTVKATVSSGTTTSEASSPTITVR